MKKWQYLVQLSFSKTTNKTAYGSDFPIGAKTVRRKALVVGMVRTMLKSGHSFKWRRAISQVSDHLLDAALDDSDDQLYLAGDYEGALRDFSATTRKGELAQALAYAYFTRRTRYKIAVDYGYIAQFASAASGSPVPQSGPDFLFVDPDPGGGYIIVECKGTCVPSAITYKKGLGQAKIGDDFLFTSLGIRADHKFAAVVNWKYRTPTGNSPTELRLRDPKADGVLSWKYQTAAMRIGLSTWFEFAQNPSFESMRRGEAPFIASQSNGPWIRIGQNDRFECFVARALLDRLQMTQPRGALLASDQASLSRTLTRIGSEDESGEGLTVLRDGTAFRIRRDVRTRLRRR